MSVHDLFTRRSSVVTSVSSERHLWWLLAETRRDFECGDTDRALDNLTHCVFVAGTDGMGLLSETELIHALRGVREAAR